MLRALGWLFYAALLCGFVAIQPVVAQDVAPKPKPKKQPARLVWFPRFSPDGTKLATAHGNWDGKAGGEVRLWEAATGKPLYVLSTDAGARGFPHQ